MPCTSSQHLPKAKKEGRKKRKKELINKHPSSSVQAAVNTRGVSVAGVSRSAHSIIEIRQVDETIRPTRSSFRQTFEREEEKKNTFEQEKGKKKKKKEDDGGIYDGVSKG